MRNFDTATDASTPILDEVLAAITDQDGSSIYDENIVTENVWEREELTAGVFVELAFDTTYRYSTFDIDMVHAGNLYTAKELAINGVSFASDLSVDTCIIQLENVGLTVSAALLNNDELGSQVTVSIGAINAARRIYDLEPIFVGELTGWSLTEQAATLNFSGLMARWSKKTLRIAQGSCPWPLGGDECGYSGAGRCGQTWIQCKALGNQLNFGGFVYLPALQESKIWWGSKKPE